MRTRDMVLLFLLAASCTSFAESEIRAKVLQVQGAATYSLLGEEATSMVPLMTLPRGAVIRTGAESNVMMGLVPNVGLIVRSNSEVVLKELGYYSRRTGFVYQVEVEVKSGSVLADVRGLMQPSSFKIITKQGVFETNNGSLFVSYRDGVGYVGIFGGQCTATLINGKQFMVLSANAMEINGVSAAGISSRIVPFNYEDLVNLQSMVLKLRARWEVVQDDLKKKDSESSQQKDGVNVFDSDDLLSNPIYNDLIQAILKEVPNTNNIPPTPPVSPVTP